MIFPYPLEPSWEVAIVTSFPILQTRMGRWSVSLVPSSKSVQRWGSSGLIQWLNGFISSLIPSLPLCPPRLLALSSGCFPGSEDTCHILAPRTPEAKRECVFLEFLFKTEGVFAGTPSLQTFLPTALARTGSTSIPSGGAGRRNASSAWAPVSRTDWLHSKFTTANLQKALTAAWQHAICLFPPQCVSDPSVPQSPQGLVRAQTARLGAGAPDPGGLECASLASSQLTPVLCVLPGITLWDPLL